ncbi:putative fatty acyl-CoA reductase CG5065 [Halyomorpha halys]|uniref:putative fatty acyl-CoA reductase CG5065 n=1 Tax=Halyomorpha halys TaxID=286706 RepID=UPI0006D4FCCA
MPTSDDVIPTFHYKMPEVPEHLKKLPDRVGTTLSGKTIFMTGSSGFLGKVLLEKIMRKTPDFKHIYLLMRPKKGKEGRQRLDEMFNLALFDKLKEMHGLDLFKRVSTINGDVLSIDLGLSKEDRELLQNEVNVVFHSAATIRFDEPLRKAVLLNTRGTKYMMELSEGMKNLELHVHISTAYCHLDQKVLEEKPYPSATDPYKIITSCELMDEELVESVSDKILKEFPNSYAFTKNLSESIVSDFVKKGVPAIILRPSIVIPTWQEPIPGWMDNINGPTGLLIGAGKGVIRTMYCNNDGYADYLPVDICVNGIMLASWKYLKLGFKENYVYNLTTNSEWQITWQQIIDVGKDIATNDIPLSGAVWYPGGSMKRSRIIHNICVILFHMIPAYFLDAIIYLSGNKPVLLRVHDRINKGFKVFEYYANNQWDFKNDQIRSLRSTLNERERIEYKIDGDNMDIKLYFSDCILSAREYILKDKPSTIPAARRHMKRLYWVDLLTRITFFSFIIFFLISSTETYKSMISLTNSYYQRVFPDTEALPQTVKE